jgi:DNA-binding beta-propeller fold protein YncE
MTRARIAALAATAATAVTGIALAQSNPNTGLIGPKNHIQPNGRKLAPTGKLTPVGNHPGGGALTKNGRFLWVLDAGRGHNDIRVLDAAPATACKPKKKGKKCRKLAVKRLGKVIQTIPMPGVSGGVAMAPDGKTAYVSGIPDSPLTDEKSPPGTPGIEGDVIHVFKYSPKTGFVKRAGTIPVPPPSGTKAPQSFPPTETKARSWPRDLAVTKDGKTLLVALNLADQAAIVNVKSKALKYVATGAMPYGAAITRDGKGLVSNETDGTVSVIDMKAGTKLKDITVGAHLSHPEGIAPDPKTGRAYVAVASEDKVAVIDTKKMTLARKLSVERKQGIGTQPIALTTTADGCRLLVADSGEDAVAVFALKKGCDLKSAVTKKHKHPKKAKAFQLIGRVPVASYPVFAGASRKRERLIWVAAKGLGVGPNTNGPNPLSPSDSDNTINSFGYLPAIVSGIAGTATFPTDAQVRKLNPKANAQVRPVNATAPPAGTPLAPGGPIKHVFYIVRENRTYDQVLGDVDRGNGDPNLTLFGHDITPNAHALVERFPLLDNVYANSEASIDGHMWTSAGAVSDYTTKNWHQNYAGRGRPYDFGVYAATWPAKRFLFDAAQAQGISYFNYGEAIAGTVPFPDRYRNTDEQQQVATKFSHSDLGEAGLSLLGVNVPSSNCYPNDASIGKDAVTGQEVYDSSAPATSPGALSRADCFRQKFQAQDMAGSVPAFTYMVLTNDHTNGLAPGRRTPQAMIADNDYALGQIVDTISHSSIWGSSLILVMEDDSQDGADHADAHRIPAFVISPYTKRRAVVHTRYDFPSIIRTMELPIGMKPFTLWDAMATPMYDAFDATPQNSEPFNAAAPTIDLTAKNPNTPANRAAVRGYNMTATDRVPQRVLDAQLWHAVHGQGSTPPPPGPNAEGPSSSGGDG